MAHLSIHLNPQEKRGGIWRNTEQISDRVPVVFQNIKQRMDLNGHM